MNRCPASSVYRAWLAAFNETDWSRFEDYLNQDTVFTFSHLLPDDRAHLRGRGAIVDSFTRWRSGFTQLRGNIVDSVGDGERAAFQLWWTGTTGEGRPIGFAACHWVSTHDERLVEIVDFFDQKTYEAMVGK